MEGWDAGTNRPVFTLYTRLLYETVVLDGLENDEERDFFFVKNKISHQKKQPGIMILEKK